MNEKFGLFGETLCISVLLSVLPYVVLHGIELVSVGFFIFVVCFVVFLLSFFVFLVLVFSCSKLWKEVKSINEKAKKFFKSVFFGGLFLGIPLTLIFSSLRYISLPVFYSILPIHSLINDIWAPKDDRKPRSLSIFFLSIGSLLPLIIYLLYDRDLLSLLGIFELIISIVLLVFSQRVLLKNQSRGEKYISIIGLHTGSFLLSIGCFFVENDMVSLITQYFTLRVSFSIIALPILYCILLFEYFSSILLQKMDDKLSSHGVIYVSFIGTALSLFYSMESTKYPIPLIVSIVFGCFSSIFSLIIAQIIPNQVKPRPQIDYETVHFVSKDSFECDIEENIPPIETI